MYAEAIEAFGFVTVGILVCHSKFHHGSALVSGINAIEYVQS